MNGKINIDQDVLTQIDATFVKKDHHLRKSTPCRVRFLGKFITTKSGKTLWRTVGHAKSAILNHFEQQCGSYHGKKNLPFLPRSQYGYVDGETMKGFIRQLESEGHLEYVPVNNEGLPI